MERNPVGSVHNITSGSENFSCRDRNYSQLSRFTAKTNNNTNNVTIQNSKTQEMIEALF